MGEFPQQSGNLSYEVSLVPASTLSGIQFGLERAAQTGGTFKEAQLAQRVTGDHSISYSLSFTDTYLAAGNPESGQAQVYRISGADPSVWVRKERLTGYYYAGGRDTGRFGESVVLRGSSLFVGAPKAEVEEISGGAVFRFGSQNGNKIGGSLGDEWGQSAILTGRRFSGCLFGQALDLIDNTFLAVGAPGQASGTGAAYIHNPNSLENVAEIAAPQGALNRNFGANVKFISGGGVNSIGIAEYNECTGSVYIFEEALGWGLGQTLTGGQSGDLFGYSMAADGETLAIGAPNYNEGSGAAFIYSYLPSTNKWSHFQTITSGHNFGKNVALSSKYLLAAHSRQSGFVSVFEKKGTWERVVDLSGKYSYNSGSFGGNTGGSRDIGVLGNTVMIGTYDENQFYYFTTGMETGEASPVIEFSGVSGKFYDQEGNYIHSYNKGERLNVSGNVFSGYHNYFINTVLVNSNCSRGEADIDSYYFSGSGGYYSIHFTINGDS